MPVKVDRRGLDKFIENAEKLHGSNSFTLGDAMTDEFISNNSNYSSLDELVDASGFIVNTPEDFKAIPDDEWDSYIGKNTEFDTWENMQRTAFKYYVKGEVKKGL
ncbi:hypothetical protein [Pseudoalteromonas nigrifaciens]|uniref:hypothetical protein n=1 Tax=Pseudoalteromonas nigrifaciens TaxID=28109 RepID=UPI0030CA4967